MGRKLILFGLAGVAALAIVVAWHNRRSTAQQPANPKGIAARALVAPLPIDQVILFSSGVGYFQREGEVDGNTRIDLSFPATDINDLLKSLVLQDLGGGTIGTISYDSPDPIERTLRSFALDLTNNPSFGQILNQARGQKIEVTLQQTSSSQPATLTGTIVGMESQRQPSGKDVIDIDSLNLNCAQGLRNVPLSQVQSVRFLNPVLDGEFKRALEVLASAHDTQKKMVSFDFRGNGKRGVRVGYVVENPIWKTSYRLVLDKNGKCALQGWAMVENTTDEDWNNVRMALISGRPISYQMDLYQPLYIPRPKVEPELFASLRPPTYSGALQNLGAGGGALGMLGFGGAPQNLGNVGGNFGLAGGLGGLGQLGGMYGLQGGMGPQGNFGFPMGNRYQQMASGGGFSGGFGGTPNVFNPSGQAAGSAPEREEDEKPNKGSRLTYEELQERRKQQLEVKANARAEGKAIAGLDPTGSIVAAASSEDIGHSYQYVIDQRVSLARQKSALLPIVIHGVEAAKVSIFNEGVQAKHPLLGLKFKNTSGRHLMQGPTTVYEGGSYAGDARIMDLQPNEERFLSYAVDLGTEIKTESKIRPGPEMTVKTSAQEFSVLASFRLRETRTYLIKNRSEQDRLVVIEHPIRENWKLVEPAKPSERSREVYRFQVPVAAGQTVKQEVAEEQERSEAAALTSSEEKSLHFPLGWGIEIKTAVKTSPEELTSMRIVKGTLHTGYKVRESKTYLIQNSSELERVFTLHHFIRPQWRRVTSKGVEEHGPAIHTIKATAPANKTVSQEVTEERVNLTPGQPVKTLFEATIRDFLASNVPSPAVRTALEKVLAANAKRAETGRQLAAQEQQLRAITDDQSRLRANLERVPQTSAAYKRYLQKLETQETEIEALQSEIKRLQADVKQQQKEYDDYVTGLTVE